MNKIKVVVAAVVFSIVGAANAQTDLYYDGETMVIPAKVDSLIEIILPEEYINAQPDVPEESISDYIAMKMVEGSNRLFVKFLRSDYPVSIHIWGAKTDRSYVIQADFLSDDKADNVYRVVANVSNEKKEELNSSTLAMTYLQRAMVLGKDSITKENEKAYTIYDNQNKVVLKTIPNFMFVLKKTYITKDFILYVMDVVNKLPVAQPLNLKNIYIPGAVAAMPSLTYLDPAPRDEKGFLSRGYRTEVRMIFDRKNKEFSGEFYNE